MKKACLFIFGFATLFIFCHFGNINLLQFRHYYSHPATVFPINTNSKKHTNLQKISFLYLSKYVINNIFLEYLQNLVPRINYA
jgi:hypothetical protein